MDLSRETVAKILAPCLLMPDRKKETEFGGSRKEELHYFCQAKGKYSRLVPQELGPPFLGNRERFYILLKALHFLFLLQHFKMATVAIRQLSNRVLCS